MSTATLDTYVSTSGDESLEYRAVHTGAIIGLVLALFSSVFPILVVSHLPIENSVFVALIPVAAMWISLWSWSKIRQQSDIYTGGMLAFAGLIFSASCLAGGTAYGAFVYATEVPDGYTRISFSAMKPTADQERAGRAIPPEIEALDGERVFIKGYIRPDSVSVTRNIDSFLLVRDNNECCFGDLSSIKFYDQMEVNMSGSLRVDFSRRVFRMGGILSVQPDNVSRGPQFPVYSLRADYAK